MNYAQLPSGQKMIMEMARLCRTLWIGHARDIDARGTKWTGV